MRLLPNGALRRIPRQGAPRSSDPAASRHRGDDDACARGLLAMLMLTVALGIGACSNSDGTPPEGAEARSGGWIGAWGAAPYGPFPAGPLTALGLPLDPLGMTALSLFVNQQAVDQSFRMIVHPTIGGTRVRVRLSNLMGDRPLRLRSVRIARRLLGPAVTPQTDTPLRFGGATEISIPPGAEIVSDAADFTFAFGDDLAVSYHVVGESGPMTWHAVSFGLNYVGLPMAGDVSGDTTGLSFVEQPSVGWFFLSGIDVLAPDAAGTIVAIGDSITDGAYEIPESNTRWPDFLARRLAGAGIEMGVLNEGINSNTVTTVGDTAAEGPPLVQRFERDVLQRPGVRSVLIFEGTNDLSAGVDANAVYADLLTLVGRARAADLCVVLATIPPRDDACCGWSRAAHEPQRQALNALIRNTGGIDAIVDFEAVLASPLEPTRPNPLLFAPDLLHPNSVGFMAMADAVPLDALVPPPMGSCGRSTTH
ncbi:MAG: GDSL-type esterase/lipase family protein [Nevskiales bacterium]|nr:GDSL-type esterase/lipase family protein [Nevskiales bacterium]